MIKKQYLKISAILIILVLAFIFYFSGKIKIINNFDSSANNLSDYNRNQQTKINISQENLSLTDMNKEYKQNPAGPGTNSNNNLDNPGLSENQSLPQDIDEKDCGFYFEEYNVCSGKCSSGKCTLEGRSCYCKAF